MEASTTHIQRVKISGISSARRISTGIIEVLISVFIYFVFAANVATETVTKFVMTPGGITAGKMADWIVPTRTTLMILIGICTVIGIVQLIRDLAMCQYHDGCGFPGVRL